MDRIPCFGFIGVALVTAVLASAAQAAPSIADEDFDCVIEPRQVVKLASPVVGVIARLDVDRGDLVKKGQILGKLEDGVEEANLALARARATNDTVIKSNRARFEFLSRKQGRAQQLSAKEFAAPATVEEASADAKVAEQQVKEAEFNLYIAQLEVKHAEEVVNQRLLRSPLDGVVVERLLMPGEYRNEQSPILTLAEIDPLRVEVFIPTPFYGQVRVGDTGAVQPEEPVGGKYAAKVTVVDHVLDASSGTFGVRLELPNPEQHLPAGLKCKIRFAGTAAIDDKAAHRRLSR
jgi:membrane fusion protein (multidrug efflux system)